MRNTATYQHKTVKILETFTAKTGIKYYMILIGEYPVWVEERMLSNINVDDSTESNIEHVEPIDTSKYSLTQLEYFLDFGWITYSQFMDEVYRRESVFSEKETI